MATERGHGCQDAMCVCVCVVERVVEQYNSCHLQHASVEGQGLQDCVTALHTMIALGCMVCSKPFLNLEQT